MTDTIKAPYGMDQKAFERLLNLHILEILEEERAMEEAGKLLRADRERIQAMTPAERREALR